MGFHCLNTGEIYQLLAAFRSTFYTGTVHIHWQFIFEIIWFLLISDEFNYNYLFDMIMMMMWCRFMSASPGFHSGYWAVPALIGIHAFPPSLSCESFWVLNTVHFIHFHFHICYCYHRAELFRVSPQLLLLSLNMNSLYASTPTQPCAPNFCVQYI